MPNKDETQKYINEIKAQSDNMENSLDNIGLCLDDRNNLFAEDLRKPEKSEIRAKMERRYYNAVSKDYDAHKAEGMTNCALGCKKINKELEIELGRFHKLNRIITWWNKGLRLGFKKNNTYNEDNPNEERPLFKKLSSEWGVPCGSWVSREYTQYFHVPEETLKNANLSEPALKTFNEKHNQLEKIKENEKDKGFYFIVKKDDPNEQALFLGKYKGVGENGTLSFENEEGISTEDENIFIYKKQFDKGCEDEKSGGKRKTRRNKKNKKRKSRKVKKSKKHHKKSRKSRRSRKH